MYTYSYVVFITRNVSAYAINEQHKHTHVLFVFDNIVNISCF